MFGPSPCTCTLAAANLSLSLSRSLIHLCLSLLEDAGSFQETSPTAPRRRSFDLFFVFYQIALWSPRSPPLSFLPFDFNPIRIFLGCLMRYIGFVLQWMELITVDTRPPLLQRAWDTSLARVLVADLPSGISFLSYSGFESWRTFVWFWALKDCFSLI